MSIAVAMLSNIEASQNEIISAVLTQLLEFVDDVVLIDFYAKFGKLSKVLQGEPNVLHLKQYEFDKWSEMQKHIEKQMSEFDKVIIFKTPTSCTKEIIDDMEKGIKLDDSYNMQYDKIHRMYERITFMKAVQNKEIYQLVIDPREIDFSNIWQYKSYKRVCAWKSDTDKYCPMFEYIMNNTFVQEIPKAQDLFFIGSVYDESKNYLYEIEKEFNKRLGHRHKGGMFNNPMTGKFKLFTFDKRENRIGQSSYLYNLMLSRYTLIVAPYDNRYFNMIRFMEAVICNCVPLLLEDYNNFSNLILTYPDIYDIIRKRGLVVQYSRVYFKIHDWWEEDQHIISEIKATESFQKIIDKEKIKKYYERLLR